MSKLNHNRPLLRYVDNIRREININTRRSDSSNSELTIPIIDKGMFDLNSSEVLAVIIFLDSIEKYIEAESAVIVSITQNITKKVRSTKKILLRDTAEKDLKETSFILFRHLLMAEIEGRMNLMNLYKHMENEIKANSPCLWEIINDYAMKDAGEKLSAAMAAKGF